MIHRYPESALRRIGSLYYFMDDFVGSTYNNYVWATRGSGGSISTLPGGVVQVTANANKDIEAYQGDMTNFSVAAFAQCTWRFKIPTITSAAGEVGFDGSLITNIISFRYDSAVGANWLYVINDGGIEVVTGTGIAATTGWVEATMICQPGSVKYLLNGAQVGEYTTRIPTALLQPFFRLDSKTGAARRVYVDWVEAYGNRA